MQVFAKNQMGKSSWQKARMPYLTRVKHSFGTQRLTGTFQGHTIAAVLNRYRKSRAWSLRKTLTFRRWLPLLLPSCADGQFQISVRFLLPFWFLMASCPCLVGSRVGPFSESEYFTLWASQGPKTQAWTIHSPHTDVENENHNVSERHVLTLAETRP
jgi:hypothetical protein